MRILSICEIARRPTVHSQRKFFWGTLVIFIAEDEYKIFPILCNNVNIRSFQLLKAN